MPTVTIDDQSCAAEVGETILQVARRNDVWIPTLCYHPAHGALCVVPPVHGGGRPREAGGRWSPPAITRCGAILTVRVSSERAVRARQGVMRLLLARAPDSPELQELGGPPGSPRRRAFPRSPWRSGNCILCGLCVRVCEERIGTAAISLSGRGVERKVSTPFGEPSEDCILCGACAAVCPVGTIRLEVRGEEVELVPFGTKGRVRRCAVCGAVLAAELVRQALLRSAARQPSSEILGGAKNCVCVVRRKTGRQIGRCCPRRPEPAHTR